MKLHSQIVTFLFSVLSLLNCQPREQQASVEQTDELQPTINLDSISYVIFEYDTAELHLYLPDQSYKTSLTKVEIIQCEELLRKRVEQYVMEKQARMDSIKIKLPNITLSNDPFWIDLNLYGRQYIAFTNSTNEKFVLVNLFCEPKNHAYWTEEYVDVDDGGPCYMQALINLNELVIAEFGVNSPA